MLTSLVSQFCTHQFLYPCLSLQYKSISKQAVLCSLLKLQELLDVLSEQGPHRSYLSLPWGSTKATRQMHCNPYLHCHMLTISHWSLQVPTGGEVVYTAAQPSSQSSQWPLVRKTGHLIGSKCHNKTERQFSNNN